MAKQLDLARLNTVQLVPPTPFTDDGRHVRFDELARFAESIVRSQVTVLLPAAGTGEFHSLSAEEVIGCVQSVRQAAPNAVVIAPIGFGVGHGVQIGQRCAERGADAALLMPPIHPYLSDAGFRDYFQAIADATPLPIVAYKKGPVPSDQLLGELGQSGRLVGVKYALNDMDAFTKFAEANHGKLGLYCGTAERFAPFFMLAGATGYTSGLGNIVPRLTLAMHAALKAGNYPEAMRILGIVRPIEDFRALAGDSFNISAIKAALQIAGWNFGPVRPPQRKLTATETAQLRRILEPILAAEEKLQ
jgi:4-hydroxy-tetrahydrodipicolinate synthase